MTRKILLLACLLLLKVTSASCQQYFNFFYTNVPPSQAYSLESATGWLYSGRYFGADKCHNCTLLDDTAKIRPEAIDSLHKEYMKVYAPEQQVKVYMPRVWHTETDNNAPYILKTMYKVTGNVLTPIYQVKVVFSEAMHNEKHDVYDISFVSGAGIKHMDNKLVMTAYKKELKEEAEETPPPVKELAH